MRSENLPHARAGDLGHLLQLAMDLREPARDETHAVRQIHGDVGDQQDPDRVVDRDRQHQIGEQHAGADDHVRDGDRREGERIEHPAGARHRAQRDPSHHEGERDDDGRRHGGEQHAGLHRIDEDRIAQDEAVVLQRRRARSSRRTAAPGCGRTTARPASAAAGRARSRTSGRSRSIPASATAAARSASACSPCR